jgi:hypothetical protein
MIRNAAEYGVEESPCKYLGFPRPAICDEWKLPAHVFEQNSFPV